eukprot:Pgem_evm1s11900
MKSTENPSKSLPSSAVKSNRDRRQSTPQVNQEDVGHNTRGKNNTKRNNECIKTKNNSNSKTFPSKSDSN